MFTGIIQASAKVAASEKSGACVRVRIEKPRGWKLALGQSVAVDGICSTVTKQRAKFFDVEYMPETLSKTTAGEFAIGRVVNLERSLTLRDFVDGHLVMGHVDATGTVVEKNNNTEEFSLPLSLMRFVAVKGSITINGVALTVIGKKKRSFSVALIPFTITHTNLGALKRGVAVNIEVDLIARYLDSLLKKS